MANSDFNMIEINHRFTVTSSTVTKVFPIEGGQDPIDEGYLLIQMQSVNHDAHKIYINNQALFGLDLPPAPGGSQAYQLWMRLIPAGYLVHGNNEIRIDREANDDFYVGYVSVNWREG